MKPGAFCKHPAGKDPLLLARKLNLVNLNERRRIRLLSRWSAVADTWRDLQRSKLDRLIDRDFQTLDTPRHLVEGCEDGDLILECLGISRRTAHH